VKSHRCLGSLVPVRTIKCESCVVAKLECPLNGDSVVDMEDETTGLIAPKSETSRHQDIETANTNQRGS